MMAAIMNSRPTADHCKLISNQVRRKRSRN
jgi:hypothetical protein